ncbi:MAG: hypothetical protein IPP64_06670 [Bacteroidetes bacterium]|nr:hypothetical protein [Bacteroidota bacterium]
MDISSFLFNTVLLVFKANRDFFILLDEFHNKLPPQHKKAEKLKTDMPFTVVNTGTMEINISQAEVDLFHKKLENFKYQRIFFKKKAIKSYSQNLQRHLSTAGWLKFGLSNIQALLEEDTFKGSKPYVFGYKAGQWLGF